MPSRSRSPRRSRSRSPPKNRSRSRSRSRSPPRGGAGKMKGVSGRWNDRGFGFIKPDDGSEDIFCHFSCITDGNCLEEGKTVEFERVFDDRKGKYRAEGVVGGCTQERPFGGGNQECFDFQKGRCDRGTSCRFSHSGGGGGGDRYGDRGGGDRYSDRGYDRGGGDRYSDRGGGDRYSDRDRDRDRRY
eukprot:TRINITY_DN267_c0_g1_i4.p2 TRINITY_DN267_c0_g1~~TRINITY_DN267_c0_g1_i4.p2  ORF type:complete len:187 (+),score=44.00 TRINITY_DN267_c0_g1_i4:242-802(+)